MEYFANNILNLLSHNNYDYHEIDIYRARTDSWVIERYIKHKYSDYMRAYDKLHKAFNWTLAQYIYFGGYPQSADLIADERRWKNYIKYFS